MTLTPEAKRLILLALREDIGSGDITTALVVDPLKKAEALIYAKGAGILAGINMAEAVFKTQDRKIGFKPLLKDGQKLKRGEKVAQIHGSASSILIAERTALNFLQHLSGIATLTNRFVMKTCHTRAVICDTRKTTPGFRIMEKYAVQVGGGKNHRLGLYDQILIKDNHIRMAGSVSDAIRRTLARNKRGLPLEVETSNLSQVKEALACGADWIMLDNFSLAEMKKPISLIRAFSKSTKKKMTIEVSGQVSLENVLSIAKTGPDLISIGQLTHSAPALDFSLEIVKEQ